MSEAASIVPVVRRLLSEPDDVAGRRRSEHVRDPRGDRGVLCVMVGGWAKVWLRRDSRWRHRQDPDWAEGVGTWVAAHVASPPQHDAGFPVLPQLHEMLLYHARHLDPPSIRGIARAPKRTLIDQSCRFFQTLSDDQLHSVIRSGFRMRVRQQAYKERDPDWSKEVANLRTLVRGTPELAFHTVEEDRERTYVVHSKFSRCDPGTNGNGFAGTDARVLTSSKLEWLPLRRADFRDSLIEMLDRDTPLLIRLNDLASVRLNLRRACAPLESTIYDDGKGNRAPDGSVLDWPAVCIYRYVYRTIREEVDRTLGLFRPRRPGKSTAAAALWKDAVVERLCVHFGTEYHDHIHRDWHATLRDGLLGLGLDDEDVVHQRAVSWVYTNSLKRVRHRLALGL